MLNEMDMRPIVGAKLTKTEAERAERIEGPNQQKILSDLSSDTFKPIVGARLISQLNQKA